MPTFENERKNWYSKFRSYNTHKSSGDGYTGGAQGVVDNNQASNAHERTGKHVYRFEKHVDAKDFFLFKQKFLDDQKCEDKDKASFYMANKDDIRKIKLERARRINTHFKKVFVE